MIYDLQDREGTEIFPVHHPESLNSAGAFSCVLKAQFQLFQMT